LVLPREKEIAALLQDLENIAEGGAAFRFWALRLWQEFYVATARNHSMERGFVVVDADLSPNADW